MKAQLKKCYGLIVDGIHHEIDEFTHEQVVGFCDAIDKMAETDDFLQQCVLDAEGDDEEEYLCDLVDNWYKTDITIK